MSRFVASVIRARFYALGAALLALTVVYFAAPEWLGLAASPLALGFVAVKLPGFANVGVSSVAFANIPIGLAYRGLLIDITDAGADPNQATISARYTRYEVKINGVTKIDLTGTQLASLNAYHGHADENGVRSIWFVQPKQATLDSEDAMLYGTANIQTMTLEVTIGAAAVTPILALYAMIDPRMLNLGAHRITRVFQEDAAGATAEYNVRLLGPYGRNGLGYYLEKVHFLASAGTINSARMVINNQDVYFLKVKLAKSINGAAYIPFTWQAGYFHLDLTQTRRLSDALNLNIADLRVMLDVSAAMTITHIWEMIDGARQPANSLRAIGLRA